MTSYPEALRDHLDGPVTTLCHCWRLTRRDGTVLGFTDHDARLLVDGTSCEPESGFAASEARSSLGLATDTVDVAGALSSDRISDEDVGAGRYDGATVRTYLVNWREPSQFALIRNATIGKITRSDGRFVAELESASAVLDQPAGRTVRRSCDAELGDARCGFSLSTPGFTDAGTVLENRAPFAFSASGLVAASGWFAGGQLAWTSGARSGTTERVLGHLFSGGETVLTLWPSSAAAIAAGDAFTITAGCDKAFATCKAKFSNAVNFRGFPHLPGNDAAYGYVTDTGQFDGGPLVP